MATASVKSLATGGSSAVLATDQRRHYVDVNSFAELYPDVTPFLSFLIKQGVAQTGGDPVFKMFEHENPWARQYFYNNGSTVTIAAALAGASAESDAVTIDNITGLNSNIDTSFVGLMFEVWDSTKTTYRGTCVLTDDTSTTTAKFKNLRTTAISTVDNDVFVCVGRADEIGIECPDAWADSLKIVWNQTGTFRTPVEVLGDLYYATLNGANNEFARLIIQKMQEHKTQIDKALWFSASPLGTNLTTGDTFTYKDLLTGDNDKVIRTTYGAYRALEDYGTSTTSSESQNLFSINEGTYKYSNFVDDMQKVFQYAMGGEKYMFCGPKMLSYWSKLESTSGTITKNSGWDVKIKMSEMQKDAKIGFYVRKLEVPFGLVNLVYNPAFKYEHEREGVIIDNNNAKLYQFRPSAYYQNIKTDNRYDGRKDEYFSELGVGLKLIKSHARFKLV